MVSCENPKQKGGSFPGLTRDWVLHPPKPELKLPSLHLDYDFDTLVTCYKQRDFPSLTNSLTDCGRHYRMFAKWHRDNGDLGIPGFPGPHDWEDFTDFLRELGQELLRTEEGSIAFLDFLRGLCRATDLWVSFLFEIEDLNNTIFQFFTSPNTVLSLNALYMARHFWVSQLREDCLLDIPRVLSCMASLVAPEKLHAKQCTTILRSILRCVPIGNDLAVSFCEIMNDIIRMKPSKSLRKGVVRVSREMIRQGIAVSWIYEQDFFQALLLQLNISMERTQCKFPPEVLAFITDVLKEIPEPGRNSLLDQLDPTQLIPILTSCNDQVREASIQTVGLFMMWNERICIFFHRPAVFVFLAHYFIDSNFLRETLWLKFCDALLQSHPTSTFDLFTPASVPKITNEDYEWIEADICPEDEVGDDSLAKLEHAEGLMNVGYLFDWLSKFIGDGGEPSVYSLNIIWLTIKASLANPAQSKWILSIVTDCSDLMSAINSIVENQTQHELEDCTCAQLILEAVQEFVG
jgi:hypothetical protein